jgi:tRNA dimethylallyltransferase
MLKNLIKYFLKKTTPKMTDILRNKPIVVIYGCTGTGKTKLSIELAKKFKAEIINADAMQMYNGLPIITNKATQTEMQDVPHNLIGFLNPLKKDYKVVEFKKDAIKKVILNF